MKKYILLILPVLVFAIFSFLFVFPSTVKAQSCSNNVCTGNGMHNPSCTHGEVCNFECNFQADGTTCWGGGWVAGPGSTCACSGTREDNYAQTCLGSRSWGDIDTGLRQAGYGGPFDHQQGELDAFNRGACPPPAPLTAPACNTPASGSTVDPKNVTFSWGAVPGAAGYHFRLWDYTTGGWVDGPNGNWLKESIIVNDLPSTSTSYRGSEGRLIKNDYGSPINLPTGQNYRYRVVAYNSSGSGPWADCNFAVTSPPICVQEITPAKNPQTGECKDFPTPCAVPQGWEKVSSCSTPLSCVVGPATVSSIARDSSATFTATTTDVRVKRINFFYSLGGASDVNNNTQWIELANSRTACSATAGGCTAQISADSIPAGTDKIFLTCNAFTADVNDPFAVDADNPAARCTGNPLANGKTPGNPYTSANGQLYADCGAASRKEVAITAAPIYTDYFRVAENPADFTEAGPYGWRHYVGVGMGTDYTFKDTTPGTKTIFVQFKLSNGTIITATECPTCQASIELVGPACTAFSPGDLPDSGQLGTGGIKIYNKTADKSSRQLLNISRSPLDSTIAQPTFTKSPATADYLTFEQAIDGSGNWFVVIPDNTSTTVDNDYTLSGVVSFPPNDPTPQTKNCTPSFIIRVPRASTAPAPNAPPTPVVTPQACLQTPNRDNEITVSWTNNSTPVSSVDISAVNSGNFGSYYHKSAPNSIANEVGVRVTAPGGFTPQSPTTGNLVFAPSSHYYARLYYYINGQIFSAYVPFDTPAACAGSVDAVWSAWSDCSATVCGTPGTQARTCTPPSNSGAPCSQVDGGNSSRSCNASACIQIQGDVDGNRCLSPNDANQIWLMIKGSIAKDTRAILYPPLVVNRDLTRPVDMRDYTTWWSIYAAPVDATHPHCS